MRELLQFSATIILCFFAIPALPQVCLTPGQAFECVGAECEGTAGISSGQQAQVDEDSLRVKVRAIDSNLSTESSYGEVYGVVIEPDADLLVRANVRTTYAGFLTGFGGGSINFGEIDIRAVIRNLDTDELIGDVQIRQGRNEGTVGGGGPDAFENFFTGPLARKDVPFDEGQGILLQAGQSYGVGVAARARARGDAINNGESDYFTNNNRVVLDAIRLITWPDPNDPAFADDDGDGLPNIWETQGIRDCDDNVLLDLPGFGADPQHKDIFVEIDRLAGREPSARAIATIKESFSRAPVNAGGVNNPDGTAGINIWVDTGGLTDGGGALVGDNLGGGNEIAVADIPDPTGQFIPPINPGVGDFEYEIDIDGNELRDYYEVKQSNFDLIRERIFHYNISAEPRAEDGNNYPGGQAELNGDDSISFGLLPVILMHEVGHNLGLEHGGKGNENCKPNYVSIMNYALVGGIPRRMMDGNEQDVDNDGDAEARILDFSPPLLDGLNRGVAPIFSADEGLDESNLSEFRELDESDPINMTRFFRENGDAVDLAMDAAPDWDGGGNTGGFKEQDVNFTEDIPGCDDGEEGQTTLEGFDDWSAITMPITIDGIVEDLPENETDDTPVPEEGDPTEDQIRDIEELFNVIDLSVAKVAEPALVMAGQVVNYEITVTNNGPNAALEVMIEDTFPELVTPLDLPDGCEAAGSVVTCALDVIERGESGSITLSGQVAPRLPCTEVDTVPLVNMVTVRNGDWQDTVPANNEATAESEALCLRYEYAAKLVCGEPQGEARQLAIPGRYSTIVNVHNFQSRTIPFFKKLALAYPPLAQDEGEVLPIAIDTLDYDGALKADCNDIAERLFNGSLPNGFVEGYLVVQTPRRLDVDAVYTAGSPGAMRTLHIEEVTERDLRTGLSIEKTSLVLPIPLPNIGNLQLRAHLTLYTMTITNDGAVAAEALQVEDTVTLALGGAVAGAMTVLAAPVELPTGAQMSAITNTAVPATSSFTVDLPELLPNGQARIRFLAVSTIYVSDPGNTLNAAVLTNRAAVSSQGPDQTLIDNVVQTVDDLLSVE